jgi:predicted nucleic acid-binding protein
LSVLFWDASALVKAYSVEQGSSSVYGALDAVRGQGALTDLVALEVFTVLSKHWRTNKLTKVEYRTAVSAFATDYPDTFFVLDVPGPVRRKAFELARTYRAASLGAMDLLHLATASNAARSARAKPVVFATVDAPLLTAAAAEGLRTFNPETDPLSKLLKLLSR